MAAQVISVNIGTVRQVEHNGRLVGTGIFKTPTTDTQTVAGTNLGADQQADLSAHGGVDKAVYAYAIEDYRWWSEQLGPTADIENQAAFFGENLTTEGLDISAARVGDLWRIGSAVLEVSEPRVPCFKLGIRTGIPRFQQAFAKADRPGAYLRIAQPGSLTVGDAVLVEETDEESATMAEIAIMYHRNPAAAAGLLKVPRLSDAWKAWARSATSSIA